MMFQETKNDPRAAVNHCKSMNCNSPIGSLKIRLFSVSVFLATLIAVLILCSRACALTIVPTFDATILNDPQSAKIQATINSAITAFQFNFSDPVTVSIKFQEMTTGLGASSTFVTTVLYSDYRAALVTHATTQDDATVLAFLPSTPNNPVNNNPNVILKFPLARALGFTAIPPPVSPLSPVDPSVGIQVGIVNPSSVDAIRGTDALRAARARDLQLPGRSASGLNPNVPTTQPDGVISLNTAIMNLSPLDPIDPTKFSLFAVVCHEIDEVLATGSALDGLNNGDPSPTGAVLPEDLFRYDQNGARSFTTALAATSFFSLNGPTQLTRFNQQQGGDFADWYSPGGQTPQVQDAFGTAGSAPVLGVELRVVDALGFNPVPAQVWVDFTFNGNPESGTFNNPYNTLAEGRDAVYAGGTVKLKGPRSSPAAIIISKEMTLQAIGGPVTIGQ